MLRPLECKIFRHQFSADPAAKAGDPDGAHRHFFRYHAGASRIFWHRVDDRALGCYPQDRVGCRQPAGDLDRQLFI